MTDASLRNLALDLLRSGTAGLDRSACDAALAAGLAQPSPLAVLSAYYQLHPVEILSLSLLQAVEEDPACGQAVAGLHGRERGLRPSLGLLATAWAGLGPVQEILVAGPAGRAGLLQREGQDLPLCEQVLRIPAPLALRLSGIPVPWPEAIDHKPIPLPPSWTAAAAAYARLIVPAGRLALRASDRADGLAAASAIAQAMGRTPVIIPLAAAATPGFGACCVLAQGLPVLTLDPGPLDRTVLPAIRGWDGPVLGVLGQTGILEAGDCLTWRLSPPAAAERAELWRQALANEPWASIAAPWRLGPARIAILAQVGAGLARLHGAVADDPAPLAAALAAADPGLGGLAVRVDDRVEDRALILPATVRADLDLLLARCRRRESLHADLGPSLAVRANHGVRALLLGPPGTGKSLSAAWLATRLGLPLYRIDLAAVASKYIGETEKNLAQVLDAAEAAELVLLFDEADALFGQRTDIRDASDRYANATTNFLLARLEAFHGIVVLTANSRTRFDAALSRRLDAVIELPPPGPEERRALWRSHLGERHRLGLAQLNRLAAASDLAGGHIRNTVLTAAVLAAEGRGVIGWTEVLAGLAGEYRKLGRALPAELATEAPA